MGPAAGSVAAHSFSPPTNFSCPHSQIPPYFVHPSPTSLSTIIMPFFVPLFLLFLLLSQLGILAQKRRATSLAVHHPIGPPPHQRRHSPIVPHPFNSRISRAQHSQALVHPPGIKPPKGVAGALNKAKLKDFMRIGREILRKRRVFRARVRQ